MHFTAASPVFLRHCEVYPACFAKYCPCSGNSDEYFETYGLKFCNAFLGNRNFSAAGKKWRDSTLRCLQEEIIPKLDISQSPSCDCKTMKSFAFTTHVKCYTQASASICDLPLGDLNEVRKTIGVPDIFSGDGRRQIGEVANICKTTAPDDGRRMIWKAIASTLGG